MKVLLYLLCLIIGYALGNIQTAILISNGLFRDDVRMHGSGNAGTNNMLRVFGKRAGAFTFLGDWLKGLIAVLLGRLLCGEIGGYLCGLAAVIGHNWPILYDFRGGKGVATTMGIAWACFPGLAAIATVLGFGVIWLTQTVSIGSLLGVTFFAFGVALRHHDNIPAVVVSVILWILCVWRHKDNISRIRKGEENKLFPRNKKKSK